MLSSRFYRSHMLYPLLGLGLTSAAIVLLNLDQRLADYWYTLQGGEWGWKNLWLTETFLHKGGRSLSISLALVLITYLPISHLATRHRGTPKSEKTKPLLYLLLAVAGSSLLVSLCKSLLGISCPWEFARYGGNLAYHNVMQQFFLRDGDGCFPAGHASAGYSWIALYFFGLHCQSKWRWGGLAAALAAGIIFGFGQQLRGAHFISHDLWTLAICWFFGLALHRVMLRNQATTDSIRSGYAYKAPCTNS